MVLRVPPGCVFSHALGLLRYLWLILPSFSAGFALPCAATLADTPLLFFSGGTLAEFIHKRCNSLLDEDTILHFFVQILLALHHVHTKQILHRDLKTQNILLDKHRMIVKIGDFGISKILSSKSKAYTVSGLALQGHC